MIEFPCLLCGARQDTSCICTFSPSTGDSSVLFQESFNYFAIHFALEPVHRVLLLNVQELFLCIARVQALQSCCLARQHGSGAMIAAWAERSLFEDDLEAEDQANQGRLLRQVD